uniref:Cytochrome c oxidase subunit 3 n=1 Tax=Siphoninus phillyreae TaxID=7040 RepID=Q6JCP5_9HEMI|nr:cytochrome oxidase subunit III [Siphoninus phillyreae]
MMMSNHFFHLVEFSPWPIIMSFNLISLGSSIIIMIMYKKTMIMIMSVFMIIAVKFQWWRDIVREALYNGCHSKMVKQGISMGMLAFITSELCFFISFFWMYFYLSLSPDTSLSSTWPPKGIEPTNYLDIPLLNTLILLTSGFLITWSHYSMMINLPNIMKTTCMLTIIMGTYFFSIQMYEYYVITFDFSDSVFSSSFFILTGFHGFHVIVGILFIMVNFVRFKNFNFSISSTAGFDYSVWYWHFVDVIWLFLCMFLYWWSM